MKSKIGTMWIMRFLIDQTLHGGRVKEELTLIYYFTKIGITMTEIGKFIRLQRRLRSWTLQELAGRCNLSVGFLSQVERGISSLSILSLNTICEAFEIPISSLYANFAEPSNERRASEAASEITKVDERPDIQISDGSIKYQFLSGEFPGRKFEILIGEIPPYYHYPPAAHEGEEFGYVLEGKLLLSKGQQTHQLGPGDSYHFLAATPHGYEAANGESAKVLWVQTLKYSTWRRVGTLRDENGKRGAIQT